MNRISGKMKGTNMKMRALAVAMAVLLCGGTFGQAGIVSYASNSLGSQGSALDGGNEGAPEGEAEAVDPVVDEIIGENQEEGGGAVSEVKVTQPSVRVRASATTSSDVVGSLKSGDIIPVVGETTGDDGKVWYQVSGEKDGKSVNGYVRSDLVEVTATAQPEAPAEAPAEAVPSEEVPAEAAPAAYSDDYTVSYEDDGTGAGVNDWYLNDTITGKKYKISELLGAAQINESNIEVMEGQAGTLRMIIIILAVIIGLLVVVVTIMIFKLRSSYDDGYYEDDEEDEDEEDDEPEEDDEEDYAPRRRGGRLKRQPSRRRYEYEDEEEDEDEEEEDDEEEDEDDRYSGRSSRREPARKGGRKPSRDEYSSSKSRGSRDYKPRNFLDVDEDDDLDFEFLDLK